MDELRISSGSETGVCVGEIMRRPIACIRPGDDARQAAALLAYYGLTSLPVVEPPGRLVGVLSGSDILRRCAAAGLGNSSHDNRASGSAPVASLLEELRVRELMLPPLFTLPPTASLHELAALFAGSGINRAYVVSEGLLLGIVSTVDLVHALTGVPNPEGLRLGRSEKMPLPRKFSLVVA